MLVGYGRTSTTDQDAGLEAQVRDLKAAGVEEVFAEQVSSMVDRPKLKECLKFLRKGDALIVTKPDRLVRSTSERLSIHADLEKRGIGLVVQSMGLDTCQNGANPTAKLILTILAGVAQWEREMMLERQREGIAKAKREGRYKGRAPTARRKADQIAQLKSEGIKPSEIAVRRGIGRASVIGCRMPVPVHASSIVSWSRCIRSLSSLVCRYLYRSEQTQVVCYLLKT